MAGSVNKAILVGNLGKDPEGRTLNSGDLVVNLTVATSDSWKDRNSGERQERTEWHKVVIFNKHLAKIAMDYLKKGSKVYIEGAIQTRKWTDQQGNDKYSTEVVLQNFNGDLTLLSGGNEDRGSGGGNQNQNQNRNQNQGNQNQGAADFDDEIPFQEKIMIQKYVKNPIVIEAVQYQYDEAYDTEQNIAEIVEFMGADGIEFNPENYQINIPTLEGDMAASVGDYIIKGIKGEFYPCKPDIFEATYDDVPDINDMPDPAEGKQETSKAAARRILPRVGTWRYNVLHAILVQNGGSSAIARRMDTEIINVRPRLSELEDAGYIYNTEEVEHNEKGNIEIVWAITTVGRLAIQKALPASEEDKDEAD